MASQRGKKKRQQGPASRTVARKAIRRSPPATREPDSFDEDGVRRVMARELDVPEDELNIDDGGRGFSSFGAGTFYEVKVGRGGAEYVVAESEAAAHELAVAVVKQDLEESPENFEPSFIQGHINLDRLRRDLSSDVEEETRSYVEEMRERDLCKELEQRQIWEPWDDDGEQDVPDEAKEKLVEEIAKEKLKDPIQYLIDVQGEEEGRKAAAEIGGLDVDAAAEEAVSTDGEGHFLSGYDGHTHVVPGDGFVYWRTN